MNKDFKILTGGRSNGRTIETALELFKKVNKLPPEEIFNLVRTKNSAILIYKDKELDEIKEYLDKCITFWRNKRDIESCEFAKYYIDAFQCVRATIFYETLD